ncbi:MAG: hypothetical protein ABFD69_11445 [Candidatus Sumerlaeia bacterium]
MDLSARAAMGWPAPGKTEFHPNGSFTFEQAAEMIERLTRHFGDLSRLSCMDLGCGPSESAIASQVLRIPWRRLVSVETFPPYLEKLQGKPAAAQTREIWPKRIEAAVGDVLPGEIDIIMMIDVIEHFTRPAALRVLARIQRLARLGVVLFVPLGDVEQDELDGNPLQRHRSEWYPRQLARFGYDLEVYERFHGQMETRPDAAWAVKKTS